MKTINFLLRKHKIAKGSKEETEQRELIREVKRLSKLKKQPIIHIDFDTKDPYCQEQFKEVLFVICVDLDLISVFDGKRRKMLSLWETGSLRIKKISVINLKKIKKKIVEYHAEYKKIFEGDGVSPKLLKEPNFGLKDMKGKSSREILIILKHMRKKCTDWKLLKKSMEEKSAVRITFNNPKPSFHNRACATGIIESLESNGNFQVNSVERYDKVYNGSQIERVEVVSPTELIRIARSFKEELENAKSRVRTFARGF